MTGEIPILKFSEDWTKLDWLVFTTIRKPHPPYTAPEGTVFHVKTPTKEFDAVLLFNIETAIADLSDELLCYDTDSQTRDEALTKLNSFYRKVPTRVQLMLLRRSLA
jgi:hypothetical protein